MIQRYKFIIAGTLLMCQMKGESDAKSFVINERVIIIILFLTTLIERREDLYIIISPFKCFERENLERAINKLRNFLPLQ